MSCMYICICIYAGRDKSNLEKSMKTIYMPQSKVKRGYKKMQCLTIKSLKILALIAGNYDSSIMRFFPKLKQRRWQLLFSK